MKSQLISLILTLTLVLNVKAESPSFSSIETKYFPTLSFEIKSASQIDSSDIIISENGQKRDFSIKTESKAVFILIESSYVTHTQLSKYAINRVIAGITQFQKNIVPNTDFAFGYYNYSDTKGDALFPISSRFQNITNRDIETITNIGNLSRKNGFYTDLYKATSECLEWIDAESKGYASKQLIIIGTGQARSASKVTQQNCINRAKELNIQISTIGLNSNDQYGFDNLKLLVEQNPDLFIKAETPDVIDASIMQYIRNYNYNYYTITYFSKYPANGEKHVLDASIKGKAYSQAFISPKNESFFDNYIYWIIFGVLAIILLAWLLYNFLFSKKKKPVISTNKSSNPTPNPTTNSSRAPKSITILDNGKKREVMITHGLTTYGRNSTNNIVIENDTVSGNHFTIDFDGSECVLTNLSRTNISELNGEKISRAKINSGDKLKAGTVEFFFS